MGASLWRGLGLLLLLCWALGAEAIGTLPLQPEAEPNDTPATAAVLHLNGGRAMARGAIAAGDADVYRLDGLPNGSRIWIYVDTGGFQNAGSNSRDSNVALYAADGTTLIEADTNDGVGNGLDSTVESTTASAISGRVLVTGGTYYVKVTGATPAAVIDPYNLYIVVTRANLPVAEVEPNDTLNFADVLIAAGATTGVRTGSIATAIDVDLYKLYARAGDVIFFAVDGDPDRNGTGSGVMAQLTTIAGDTTQITCFVGVSGDAALSCAAGFKVFNTGYYYIRVQQNSGTGNYALMAATMTYSVVDAVAEIEPNDTLASANRLVLNHNRAIVAGTLPPGDVDFFQIDYPDVSSYVAAIAETGGPTNGTTRAAVLTLYNNKGEVVQMNTGGATGNGLDDTVESTQSAAVGWAASLGPFWLKVEALDPTKTLEYRLYVVVMAYQQGVFDSEPNEGPGTAQGPEDFNQTAVHYASIETAGDVDWYKIKANAGDVLFAALDGTTFNANSIDMIIDLYAPDGSTLLLQCHTGFIGSDSGRMNEACLYQVGRPGTYYFTVKAASAGVSGVEYAFVFANMTPPGSQRLMRNVTAYDQNTPEKAYPLTLNGWRSAGYGNINFLGDHDYWRVDGVPPNSKIWVFVDGGWNAYGLGTDVRVELLAADGTTVIEADDDDGTGSTLDGTIESPLSSMIAGRTLANGGNYYVRVGHYNNSSTINPYYIYVTVTPPWLVQTSNIANDTRLTADNLLLPGDLLQARNGSIGAAGDVDYYKFAAEGGDEFFFGLDANPNRDATGPDLVLEIFDETGASPLLTCDSSSNTTMSNSAAEGCAYRFPDPGVYYARVREKTGTGTGAYTVMVANMSQWLTFDIDATGMRTPYDALTDGLLIVRHMRYPANTNDTVNALGIGAMRTTEQIGDYLDLLTTALDIDGDGVVDPATDGVLILRYMMGIRFTGLLEDAVSPNASRKQYGDILQYLEHLMP